MCIRDRYEHTDKIIKYLNKRFIRIFNKAKTISSFEELNVIKYSREMYDELEQITEKAFLLLARPVSYTHLDVYKRQDGWSAAEARAKDTELMFKMSEKQFLKLAIKIANDLRDMNLKLSDIEIRFTRRNYENIQEKAQVLLMMLSNDKIHPQLAFEHCGLFIDSEIAYTKSKKYADEKEQETEKALEEFSKSEVDKNKRILSHV